MFTRHFHRPLHPHHHSGADGSDDEEGGHDAHDDEVDSRRPSRIVEKDGAKGLVRVHWLRYPESYDEWRAAGDAPPGARPFAGGGEEVGGCGWVLWFDFVWSVEDVD